MTFKANFSIFKGKLVCNDYTTDGNLGTKTNKNAKFDGMNTYGDENRIFVPYDYVKVN